MKTISDLLKEKGYRQQFEGEYKKTLEDSNNKMTGDEFYYYTNNDFICKSMRSPSKEEYEKRCMSLGPQGYEFIEFGEFIMDTNVIIYNYNYDFYIIYSYKKIGIGGFGEYVMLKDGKKYDPRDISDWLKISIPENRVEEYASIISKTIHHFTDKQASLSGTVSGNNAVYYNEDVVGNVDYIFNDVVDEIKELTKANICHSESNDLYIKVSEALNNDDYKTLSKLVDDNSYVGGNPLIIEAIMANKFNILDELIKNKKCINQQELMYHGTPASYVLLKIEDKKLRMKYLKKLVDKKCDYNIKDVFNRNLIYDAIETMDEDVFDYVYNLKGIEIDNESKNDSDYYTFSMVFRPLFVTEECYYTPLQFACLYKNYYAVEKMVNKKNVNYSNILGSNLYIAIMNLEGHDSLLDNHNKHRIVELLLEKGADLNWESDSLMNQGKSVKRLIERQSNDEKLMSIINKYLNQEEKNE